jgi:transcriptional regulator with XRE-family HTH domain
MVTVKGYETLDDYIARRIAEDPEYAKAHAIGSPIGYLSLNVWSLRLTKGLTQQQLADAVGMKQPRIATLERDGTNPTLETISRIAYALGVTADRLLVPPDKELLAQARAVVAAEIATWPAARRRRLGLDDETLDGPAPQPEAAPPRRRRKTA